MINHCSLSVCIFRISKLLKRCSWNDEAINKAVVLLFRVDIHINGRRLFRIVVDIYHNLQKL